MNPSIKTLINCLGRMAGAWICLGVLIAIPRAAAQSEDAVKSAFLFNFAKFVEWPADAPAGKLVVGFVAADGLADTFQKNVVGKNANGREFEIKKVASGDAPGCHIIYVADAGQVGAAVSAAKGKPVLVVGEGEGGAIVFLKDGPKVGFNLDLDAAKAANLKVDPKLQKVAKSVKGA
jgi:hypothetical protein